MKRLVIRLLGGFEAVLDGNPLVGFESDKVRALLAYLVMYAGWSQRREKLTGLLWPDSPESSAQACLRNALANLRQAIGDRQAKSPFLCVTRQAITFEGAGDYWLDVADFEQAFQNNTTSLDGDRLHLEKAISLYRGPLLDGFSVPSITFQEWLLLERERLNRQMVDALCRLTLCYAEEGLLEKALHHAWRQVELEPWEEKGQRLLIGLLAASGRRGEALAQYDHCCQMLRETLDVEPSAETVALHHQILVGEVPIPSSRPPNNLPVWLTPLIGRESEVAWVQAQLDNPHCRLLTLTGPGGIGKTHLALEAVKAKLNHFPDGVYLVSLAALPSTQDIVPVLAQALNLPSRDYVDLHGQLFDYLCPKKLLLVLDSFEYLIAAPGLASQTGSKVVSRLLEEAPRLKILVTSRMRLNLYGEHVLALEGLRYPLTPASIDPDDYSAMALFLKCTRRLRPRYVPTADDLMDITRICQQVEGLPLAILLAASWMELLTPREISQEIDRDIDFLTTESGNIPQRHRSLRAVFNHSWRLLSDSEQAIYQSLSVFRGGFTRVAAQAVAGASVQDLRTLGSRSLLQRSPKGRYTLHPLLRHYAAEKLADVPETHAQICNRHSAFYTTYSHDWAEILKGKHQQATIADMRQEINNLEVAWEWAITNREISLMARGLDGLCLYYTYHNRHQKGLATCQAAASQIAKDQSAEGLRLMARLLSWQSTFGANLGQMEQDIRLSQQSLAIHQEKLLAGEEVPSEKASARLQLARQLTKSDLQKAG